MALAPHPSVGHGAFKWNARHAAESIPPQTARRQPRRQLRAQQALAVPAAVPVPACLPSHTAQQRYMEALSAPSQHGHAERNTRAASDTCGAAAAAAARSVTPQRLRARPATGRAPAPLGWPARWPRLGILGAATSRAGLCSSSAEQAVARLVEQGEAHVLYRRGGGGARVQEFRVGCGRKQPNTYRPAAWCLHLDVSCVHFG